MNGVLCNIENKAAGHVRCTGLSRRSAPVLLLLVVFACFCSHVFAQHTITWWTNDGAGGNSAGGVYSLIGVAGQPDSGNISGGTNVVQGGFLGGFVPNSPSKIANYIFASTAEGWTFAGQIPSYSLPGASSSGGHLALNPLGSTNAFSYWYSPEIAISNNKLYRSSWLLGSSSADANKTVQSRLRVNQVGSWQAWARGINSNNSRAPSAGKSVWYDVYFNPNVTGTADDGILLNFDIMSFDPNDNASSSLYLEEVYIEEVFATGGTDIKNYTFAAGAEGWTFAGTIPPYTAPASGTPAGFLAMNPTGSTNCFSFWGSPDVTVGSNKKYRAIFKVSSSVASANDSVQFRIRCNQKGSWQSWERTVNSNNNQGAYTTPKDYQLIIDVPIESYDNLFTFAFDLMSFDSADNTYSTLYLDNMLLEEVSINP